VAYPYVCLGKLCDVQAQVQNRKDRRAWERTRDPRPLRGDILPPTVGHVLYLQGKLTTHVRLWGGHTSLRCVIWGCKRDAATKLGVEMKATYITAGFLLCFSKHRPGREHNAENWIKTRNTITTGHDERRDKDSKGLSNGELAQRSQYSDYGLDVRGVAVRVSVGTGFSSRHSVHPASYPIGTLDSFPGDKAAGAWSWPLTN
jgi:hypothetical protein